MNPMLIMAGIVAFGVICGGIGMLIGGVAAYRLSLAQKAIAASMEAVAAKVQNLDANIARVEIQTNSMKDALVALTDKEAHARGMKDQAAATAATEDKGA